MYASNAMHCDRSNAMHCDRNLISHNILLVVVFGVFVIFSQKEFLTCIILRST